MSKETIVNINSLNVGAPDFIQNDEKEEQLDEKQEEINNENEQKKETEQKVLNFLKQDYEFKNKSSKNNPNNESQFQKQKQFKKPVNLKRLHEPSFEEQELLHRAKITTVEGYLQSKRFGPFLTERLLITADKVRLLDNNQLDDLYYEIKTQLMRNYKERFVETIVKTGLKTIENVVSEFYNIKGFELILINNQEFLDCLEEMKIEINGPSIPLPVRLGLCMVQTAVVCNQLNSLDGSNVQRLLKPESNQSK